MKERKSRLNDKIEKKFGSSMLTTKQVQLVCSLSSSTLSRLISSNSISYSRLGKSANSRLIFHVEDVVNFIFDNYVKCNSSVVIK